MSAAEYQESWEECWNVYERCLLLEIKRLGIANVAASSCMIGPAWWLTESHAGL